MSSNFVKMIPQVYENEGTRRHHSIKTQQNTTSKHCMEESYLASESNCNACYLFRNLKGRTKMKM